MVNIHTSEEFQISIGIITLLLHLVATGGFAAMVWFITSRHATGPVTLLVRCEFSGLFLLATAASSPELWIAVATLYPGDSHHTLPGLSGLFVFLLAVILALCGVSVAQVMTERLSRLGPPAVLWAVAPIAAAMVFTIAIIAAPQVFYMAYLTIFDGLPMQGVIDPIRTLARLPSILFWHPGQSMSADGTSLVLHAMILVALAETARLHHLTFFPFCIVLGICRFLLNIPAFSTF